MDKNKAIPSMFHRRLVLLLVVCVATLLILTGQMFRLSVVQGGERLAQAESRLTDLVLLPTYRGRILDRHGRVLAIDRPCYDVAIQYKVITGAWARRQAALLARREIGRNRWLEMGPKDRDAAIVERLPAFEQRTEDLWAALCRHGNITREELFRRLDGIKADVQSTAANVWENQRREQLKFGISEEDFKPQEILEQRQAHVVLPRVPDEVAFEFRRMAQASPDMIEVQDSTRREYPWLSAEVPLSRASLPWRMRGSGEALVRVAGIADHILGSVRDEVWADDVKRRPFSRDDLGGYRPGDNVGSRGVEASFESSLRGSRGQIAKRLDTGEQVRIDPTPGADVNLSIDIALQARVQAILSWEFGLTRVQPWHNNHSLPMGLPLNSAAVVIEVETGEVLAMVTMPTIAMGEAMTAEERAANFTMVNRATETPYPPGSIIKPLVLAAGVSESLHDLAQPINCTGHYFENQKNKARCWIYRDRFGMMTHGPLKAEEALARSCNIFFYSLGDRLGIDRINKWFNAFGMGEVLDVGLIARDAKGEVIWRGEHGGMLPSADRVAELRRRGELKFTEVIMGIGQGPVAWTPVQAANAYATLARGGYIRDATLVTDDPRGTRPKRCGDLNLSPELVKAALEGLRESVMESFGTGHHMTHDDGSREPIVNAVDVTVWAKTGTAQANRLRQLDHSWFVGLVGPRGAARPLHAIAVIVENGGSGGRCAGPIANQIIHALQAEGYLPGDHLAISETQGDEPRRSRAAEPHVEESEGESQE